MIEKVYFRVRPHHFLCLEGFKGFGYNPEHAKSWNSFSQIVKANPDIPVQIVSGEDSLCLSCPNSKKLGGSCDEKVVSLIDRRVKEFLSLEYGKTYIFREIICKAKCIFDPELHEKICGHCGWRAIHGFCKDTFKKVFPD